MSVFFPEQLTYPGYAVPLTKVQPPHYSDGAVNKPHTFSWYLKKHDDGQWWGISERCDYGQPVGEYRLEGESDKARVLDLARLVKRAFPEMGTSSILIRNYSGQREEWLVWLSCI